MEQVEESLARITGGIVVTSMQQTRLRAVPAALSLPLMSSRKPYKLTPLEKKERDRLRMREQSQRRKQVMKDQCEQAKRFAKEKESSFAWHQQQRHKEELVLRRLERDVVEPQRSHPAAAGYHFADAVQKVTASSPVFVSYSYALFPPTQAPRLQLRSRSGLQRITNYSTEAEFLHPSCHGYAMAKHDDCSRISPVFFFTGFTKISLDEIVIDQDDVVTDEFDVEDRNASLLDSLPIIDKECELSKVAKQCQQDTKRHLKASMATTKLAVSSSEINGIKYEASKAASTCLVCKKAAITIGCPGCFTISSNKQNELETAQRHRTMRTMYEKEEDICVRHKALQRQIIIPPSLPRLYSSPRDAEVAQKAAQENVNNTCLTVLSDSQAIRKYSALSSNVITLHVKSLPVGQLLSLTADLRTSVSCLYQQFRAKTNSSKGSLHLLLPTTRGLFYLDERIMSATDTRIGVVNGELLLEDFNLQKTASLIRANRVDAGDDNLMSGEFLLFAVVNMHPQSTPQLIFSYVQHNFNIKLAESQTPSPFVRPEDSRNEGELPQWARIVFASCLLPKAVDLDPFQVQIRPHIQAMHVFTQTKYAIVAAEQREERERLLLLAHEEAKTAKLTLKKQRRSQQASVVSNKIRRAVAYFKFICESTSNVRQFDVAEERLGKLWQFVQLLNEWKIFSGGRLLDAERSDVTLSLAQELEDTVAVAFGQMITGATMLNPNKGGGTLPYPVLCLKGSGAARKLVLHLGIRMGVTEQDDCDYGIMLDLDHDYERVALNRGHTEDVEPGLDGQMVEAWDDMEWRKIDNGSSPMAQLITSSDLLSFPFYRIKWPLILKAYNVILKRAAFVSSKLDEFNTLTRVLRADAVLSTAQLTKWQEDVDHLFTTLPKQCALARAVQRMLCKKGVAVLKHRAQKQRRAREEKLHLHEPQLTNDRPNSMQQQSVAFKKKRASELHLVLDLTPGEIIYAKASELLGKAAAGMAKAARHVKREYAVRTL